MLKLVIATILSAALLSSCGGDSGINSGNNGGGGQSVAWAPVDSLLFGTLNTLPRLLHVEGNKLYVAGDGGFIGIVDCADSNHLNLLGHLPSNGSATTYPMSMAIRGNYLFCAMHTDVQTPDSLVTVDVSNPSAPTLVSVVESTHETPPGVGYLEYSDCFVAGDTLGVYAGALELYRILPDGHLSLLNTYTLWDFGTCPYGAMGDVWISPTDWYFFGSCVDTAAQPELRIVPRGTFSVVSHSFYSKDFRYTAYQFTDANRHAYFVDRPRMLRILDVSDYTNPTPVGNIALPSGLNVPADFPSNASCINLYPTPGGFAFLCHAGGGFGVLLLDAGLHYTKYYQDPGLLWDIATRGNRLYVTSSTAIMSFPIP